jgi:hypothetical protein
MNLCAFTLARIRWVSHPLSHPGFYLYILFTHYSYPAFDPVEHEIGKEMIQFIFLQVACLVQALKRLKWDFVLKGLDIGLELGHFRRADES